VLAINVLLFALYSIYKETNQNRSRSEIVNIDPETNIEEVFRLGTIEHIKGFQSVIVPLYSDQNFSLKYSGSKSIVSTRNLLFSNMLTQVNKWLLPKNNYLIANHRLINETNSYDRNIDVVTILYSIVKSDTNSDSRLTISDKVTVALSDPEGNNYTEVLKDIDDVLGYEILEKKVIAIMFNRENQGFITYVKLSDFKVTKEIELPKIN